MMVFVANSKLIIISTYKKEIALSHSLSHTYTHTHITPSVFHLYQLSLNIITTYFQAISKGRQGREAQNLVKVRFSCFHSFF